MFIITIDVDLFNIDLSMINIINFLLACTTIACSLYLTTHYNTYVFPQSLLGIAVDKDHKSHLHAGVIDYYVDIVNK